MLHIPGKKALKRVKKPGLAPGTLIYTGKTHESPPELTLFTYTEAEISESTNVDLDVLDSVLDPKTNSWLNVSGIHDVALIEQFGHKMGFHPLILEDIVHPEQRPKLEVYDDHLYVVAKMLYHDADGTALSEQVSLILGKTFVISFQEKPGDVFGAVRERLRSGKGMMRKMGPDYLTYALLDLIVDHYFVVLEEVGTRMELFEMEVMENPTKQTMAAIREQKKVLIDYRRSIWPLREVISALTRDESGLVKKKTVTYLRDVYDHTIQVIDLIESYRDLLAGLTDLYLSSLSIRMNEVMQVLTIIGSIFIPITFVAGVYGMNFQVMPELAWKYGYAGVWVVMAAIAFGLIMFFKRKKWL